MSEQEDSDEIKESYSSTSSRPSSDTDTFDWNLISEWCRNLLGLSEAEIDSLWCERMALIALHHDDRPEEARILFQRALGKEKPSWLCHQGLGMTYDGGYMFTEALKWFEVSLTEAEKDGAEPKPEQTDLSALHLLIGRCALNAGNLKKAAEAYLRASSSKDADQAMRAQVGHMKAVMRSSDAEDAIKWLRDKLSEGSEGRRLHDILNMAVRDDEHVFVIPRMLTLALKLDKLDSVLNAMKTATARPGRGPGTEIVRTADKVDQLLQDESVGVLKYYWGLAAYIFSRNVSSGTERSFHESLGLWEECRDQLCNLSTFNASLIHRRVRVKIAQHHFEDMLDRDSLAFDGFDRLVRLAQSESPVKASWEASGFLAALYAHHGKMDQSKAVLAPRVRLGLQVLSDETPENDSEGFYELWVALVQSGDFSNGTTALLLSISPDFVATALAFKSEDIQDSGDLDRQRLLDMTRVLAEKTLGAVRTRLPETSWQQQRLNLARQLIDEDSSLADHVVSNGALTPESEGKAHTTLEDPETVAAYRFLRDRLNDAQQEIAEAYHWRWSCDGRTADGNRCQNQEVNHCIYCQDIDFCDECLSRFRDTQGCYDMELTVCSSRHRWLKLPLPSTGLYAGPRAKSLRTPKVRERHGDAQILEVLVDGDAMTDVEKWKADLAKAWNIVLEEG